MAPMLYAPPTSSSRTPQIHSHHRTKTVSTAAQSAGIAHDAPERAQRLTVDDPVRARLALVVHVLAPLRHLRAEVHGDGAGSSGGFWGTPQGNARGEEHSALLARITRIMCAWCFLVDRTLPASDEEGVPLRLGHLRLRRLACLADAGRAQPPNASLAARRAHFFNVSADIREAKLQSTAVRTT